MFESEADVVEAFEQAALAERIDFKEALETLSIADFLILQVHRERVAFIFFEAPEKFVDVRFGKRDRQNSILETVVVENVRVARRDNRAETVIADGPGRVFAARTESEISARQQNRSAFVARLVQREI